MKSATFRLVYTDEQNPKGKIVGYIKIGDGDVWFSNTTNYVLKDKFKWCNWLNKFFGNSETRSVFTYPEPLAPFKAADGGDLYAGDKVEQGIARGVLTFNQEDTRYCWSIRDDDNFEVWCVLWTQPITKLGTIHD